MIIRVFVSYILFMLFALSCNVSNQESVDTRTTASVSDETFSYSSSTNVLVAGTTALNISPLLLTPATYSITPALPTGLSISAGSGVITGTATSAQSQTLYVITAQTASGNEYAQITIEVTDEPVKTLVYPQTNLEFTKDSATASGTYTPTTTGGTPTLFSVETALPSGLALNPLTGDISGTPTSSGAASYVIKAENAAGYITTQVLIDVKDAAPAGLSYTAVNNTADVNVGPTIEINASLTSSPDSVTYTISPNLPAGVSINASTGKISGIPTEYNGITSYTVTVSNATGTDTEPVTINIGNPPTSLTYNWTTKPEYNSGTLKWQDGVAISNIFVANLTGGVPPITYSCTGCPSGVTVNSSSGVISGTPDDGTMVPANTFYITATDSNADTVNSANISFEVVEDYPEDYNNLGYASVYTLYVDNQNVISLTPASLPGGNASSYELVDISYGEVAPLGAPYVYNTPVTGLTFEYADGSFDAAIGALTGAVDVTLVVEGYNQDGGGNPVKTGEQQIQIKVVVLPPTKLGYTGTNGFLAVNAGTLNYNTSTSVLGLTEGQDLPLTIDPSAYKAGGTPDTYTIFPQLPDGLTLNATNGQISGRPTESTPVTYYTITGTNDGGSHSESFAISTDIRIAPQSFEYANSNTPTHYGDLTFTIFSNQTEACDYVGSSGTFSIDPALPLGLNIHPTTGAIYGTPLASVTGGTYNVTVTNELGSLTRNIELDVNNINAPSGLAYTDADGNTPIILYAGDAVTSSDILHTSNFDPNNSASTGGFIESYSEVTAELTNLGLSLDLTSGDITSPSAIASASREQDYTGTILVAENNNVQIQGTNDQGNDSDTFTVAVVEKPPVISYDTSYGTNVILIKGDNRGGVFGESDAYSQFIDVTNSGGLVAETFNGGAVDGNVSGEGCYVSSSSTANYNIDQEYRDYYADDSTNSTTQNGYHATNFFSFEVTNCSFRFNANTCFSTTNGGLGNETQTYTITAKNSGTEYENAVNGTAHPTTNITVHLYDGPNYIFEPEGDGQTTTDYFYGKHHLTLDGSDDLSGLGLDSYTPYTTNMCHSGSFDLTDISDLQSEVAWSGSTGGFSVGSQILMGRANFTHSATETASGLNLTQSEAITVQANHIENNAGSATHLIEVTRTDVNADGKKDVIMRSTECDSSLACNTNNASIYIQDATEVGFFDGVNNAAANVTGASGLKYITGITYASGKGGILAISSDRYVMHAYSASEGTELNAADANSQNDISDLFAGAFRAYGVVPVEAGIVENIGLVARDTSNGYVRIVQYTIVNDVLGPADATGSTATYGIVRKDNIPATQPNVSYPSIYSDSIEKVYYFDMDADGDNEAVIHLVDGGTHKICILAADGTNGVFPDDGGCTGIIPAAAGETIKKVVFADIAGDSLLDIAVLTNATGGNTVTVYENKSNVNVPGDFNSVDTLSLASDSSYANFDIADLNNDGYPDLIAADLRADLDGDGSTTPDDPEVTGFTIYYHTNSSNIYQSNVKAEDDSRFFYHLSSGHTYNVEVLESAGSKALMNCSIQTGALGTSNGTMTLPNRQITSCGIVGVFN